MNIQQYYGSLVGTALINIFVWLLIRQIIWSIIWCERGKRHRSLRKLKSKYSWFKQLTQNAFIDCIATYKKNFVFWISIKRLHVGLSILLLCIGYVVKDIPWRTIYASSFFGTSVLFSICVMLQFDVNRQTKYDRIRMKK